MVYRLFILYPAAGAVLGTLFLSYQSGMLVAAIIICWNIITLLVKWYAEWLQDNARDRRYMKSQFIKSAKIKKRKKYGFQKTLPKGYYNADKR